MVTDEMVEAAFAAYVREKSGYPNTRALDWMRPALEAALAAAPACPHIRSTAEGTHHCALAAAPQPEQEPVAWAQKASLDGVREYGEIICTLYADGYQPEQEWTEPIYTAPQPAPNKPSKVLPSDTRLWHIISRHQREAGLEETVLLNRAMYRACTEAMLNVDPAPQPAPDALREAAQQALAWVEAEQEFADPECGDFRCSDCQVTRARQTLIDALRAALEGDQ